MLRGASLRVYQGEVVGLIGGNGSGKTTLLNALSGFVEAEGSIHLDGVDVTGYKPWRRVRAGICRTVQRQVFSTSLGLEEVQEVRAWCRRLPPSEEFWGRLQSTMRSCLPVRARGRDSSTEGSVFKDGKVRRDLEEAFAADPRALLLDEPLAGEAGWVFERLSDLLRALRRDQACGIVVEHRVGLLRRLVDRVWELRNGVLVES